MDIASDDGDNNPTVESFVYDFYKQQAEDPRAEYPEIYVGDHVPALGEARGRLKAQKSYEPVPLNHPKSAVCRRITLAFPAKIMYNYRK